MKIGIMIMLGIITVNSMFYSYSETIRKNDNTVAS